jgi:hypothetical protein
MIRTVFTELGLFVTPFVLYAAFLLMTRTGPLQSESWTMPRLAALVVVSLMLVIGSFLLLAQFSGAPPGSTYVPAHLEDGKLVPGATR